MASGELASKYNKLEVQRFQEEIDAMNRLYGGIKDMNGRPGAVFVVDVVNEANAVKEARKMGVPIVAIVDSNADPSLVTHVIPANDDAIKAIQLITDYVQAAIEQGRGKIKTADDKDAAPKAPKTDAVNAAGTDSEEDKES
ncbi:MAG TPA: 30S ribosomal protein S2, partial [Candidatus Saccharimonadales bacterium]